MSSQTRKIAIPRAAIGSKPSTPTPTHIFESESEDELNGEPKESSIPAPTNQSSQTKKRKANSPIKPTNPTTNPNTINTNQKAELEELANQLTNIGEELPKDLQDILLAAVKLIGHVVEGTKPETMTLTQLEATQKAITSGVNRAGRPCRANRAGGQGLLFWSALRGQGGQGDRGGPWQGRPVGPAKRHMVSSHNRKSSKMSVISYQTF